MPIRCHYKIATTRTPNKQLRIMLTVARNTISKHTHAHAQPAVLDPSRGQQCSEACCCHGHLKSQHSKFSILGPRHVDLYMTSRPCRDAGVPWGGGGGSVATTRCLHAALGDCRFHFLWQMKCQQVKPCNAVRQSSASATDRRTDICPVGSWRLPRFCGVWD
jgi:hypothetical protein